MDYKSTIKITRPLNLFDKVIEKIIRNGIKLKKQITPILFFFFLSACKNIEVTSFNNDNLSFLASVERAHQIDKSILKTIHGYYKNKYSENARIVEIETDISIELTFYNIPKSSKETDYLLMEAVIPKIKSINKEKQILIGHLNDDETDDLLISVSVEGGGVGSLPQKGKDYFIFLNENNRFILTKIVSDKELVNCELGGRFSASKIENGQLVGISYCYDENDPNCCPSLAFVTELKLTKKKLVVVKQDLMID